MKARFFFGDHCYNTWPKVFVLTEDGKFYSEYLNHMRRATVNEKFDFDTFQAEDYKWGGYQSIVEIDEKTAKRKILVDQRNWVGSYLERMK